MRRNYKLVLLLLTAAAGTAAMAGWALVTDRRAPIPHAQGDQPAPPPDDRNPPDSHRFLALERVQDDPLGPDYHPVGRPRAQIRKLRAIFESEPRDPRWAPSREALLAALVGQDLKRFAGARFNFADCRKVSCRFEVGIPTADVQRYLKQRLPVGNAEAASMVQGVDGIVLVTVYSSIKPRFRDDNAYAGLIAKQRRASPHPRNAAR